MLCILQVGLSIWGLVTLIRGRISFGSRTAVGMPAYLAGFILLATLPLVLVADYCIAISIAAQNPGIGPQQLQDRLFTYWWVDVAIPVLMLVFASMSTEEAPPPGSEYSQYAAGNVPPNYPPMDPNNPYASPQGPTNPYGECKPPTNPPYASPQGPTNPYGEYKPPTNPPFSPPGSQR